MTLTCKLLTLAAISYFLGSIPFGLLVGLSKGIDPRKAGSGNIGATNVGRLLGGKYFAAVFILDLLKSLIPMLLAGLILRRELVSPASFRSVDFALWLLVGLAAILGHMFSVFLRFRGGKGVSTSAGVILGLYPYYTLPAIVAIIVFIVVFLRWRFMSLASMAGAFAFPLAYAAIGLARHWQITGKQLPLLVCAILVAALIIIRHRANIGRLLKGTEKAYSTR